MNALHTYLNGQGGSRIIREKKPYEQLLLPKIMEHPHHSSPKTSLQNRHPKKKESKYSSQTTLSPQQEHLHDQLKIVLGPSPKTYEVSRNNREFLPKIVGQKGSNNGYKFRKSKSTANQKLSLQKILNDPHSFMQNYFEQIHKTNK